MTPVEKIGASTHKVFLMLCYVTPADGQGSPYKYISYCVYFVEGFTQNSKQIMVFLWKNIFND